MQMLKHILVAAAFAAAIVAGIPAFAQSYPSQSVKIVVGFPPGGTTDVIGRLVAQGLSESLGKSFFVDNRGGASGTIGAEIVAKSQPDGHTLLVVSSTHGTAPALYASMPYQEKDLIPVSLIATTPYVFVVHPSIQVNTFPQLLALLKQNPGKYNFASSSPGTAQHLGGELVKRMAGVDMVHVPYKGSGVLMPDLLSGRVPMMFENVAIMTPHIKKGSLKPLAVSSAKRTLLLPDVPTVAESGLAGFEVLGWFALLAPAGTPPEVIKLLNSEMNKLIVKPVIVERFA
ncbi:MAG TPA: tripartite tricarboxylate transporter substrate binding protein, partial [Chthoniobacterales bacterium]|nr:tripartite tricarboxylate transporter substrate binding protein [Chthoniobacterales bacterium]